LVDHPHYGKGDDFEKNLIRRDSVSKMNRGRGRRGFSSDGGEYRGTPRRSYSRHANYGQDDYDDFASRRSRSRGRGRGKYSRGQYKRGDYNYRISLDGRDLT
jgi:hypothetical protein